MPSSSLVSSEADNNDGNRLEKSESLKGSDDAKPRGQWGGKFEFLLAIIGYTVATGSIWRFPVFCAKNGGGAFLIPFAFFLVACGGPLYYLEVCLGQFSGKSAVAAFEFCPLFKGLGCLMVMISLLVTWYIMAVMMWILYFTYSSFLYELPWTTCDNWWNTINCTAHFSDVSNTMNENMTTNVSDVNTTTNILLMNLENSTQTPLVSGNSPAYEFWIYNVLRKSEGLEDFGAIQLHLAICLFVGWVIVILAVLKGVKTLGKVVYVTATLPYVLLTVMFIRGLTLDGALDGIRFFVTPDFEKITHFQVWLDAAIQVFFSLGPTWGGVITMASYNEFHKKSFRDTAICVGTDLFTNFYSGLVVFCIIGFMANEENTTVAEMAKVSGPGLVFIAYPTAIGRMPLPHLWAVLFFFMLITVAFDTNFGLFETVTSALIDTFPQQLVRRRPLVNIATGVFLFLIGLPFTCNGGLYIFQLVDWYASAFALIFGSALEGIVVFWIYGSDRFSTDITMMTGREVSVLLRVLWVIVTPFCMVVSFFIMLSGYSQPDYGDGYRYEPYAIAIGFIIGLLPIFAFFGGSLWEILGVKGNLLERMRILLRPSTKWGPSQEDALKIYQQNEYVYPNSFIERMWINIRGPKGTPWI